MEKYHNADELLKLFSETRNPKSWKRFYSPKLNKFFKFIAANFNDIPFYKIDSKEINDFLESLKPSEKTHYHNALNTFYRFTYRAGKTDDVMKDVEKPIIHKKNTQYIEDEHIKLIKDYIENDRNKLDERMLLAFCLYTGLERGDIFTLYNGQLQLSETDDLYYLWIEEEDGEQCQLPLNSQLQQLIKVYKSQKGADNPFNKVFGFSETYITRKIKDLSKKITGTSYNPQVYIDTFLKRALVVNNDVYAVSKLALKSLSAIQKHITETPEVLLKKQQSIVDAI